MKYSSIERLGAALTFGLSRNTLCKEWLRKFAEKSSTLLLNLRSVNYSSDQRLRCLVIAPHPDDEVLGCAALIFRKRQVGAFVHVVYLTDGGASHPNHPSLLPDELKRLREQEARTAMELLGVEHQELTFLGSADGELSSLNNREQTQLTGLLASLIDSKKPDEIFVVYHLDASAEHRSAFMHTQRALQSAATRPRILQYAVWSRWNPVRALPAVFRASAIYRLRLGNARSLKQRAIAAYATQTRPMAPWKHPVLSAQFVAFFSQRDEYFFEFKGQS